MQNGLERTANDLRYAVRALGRQRTFAATAILTLAIGTGAATAVFSVVESELWRPLPFPHADRLVAVFATEAGTRPTYDRASGPEFLDWRARSGAFEDLAAYRGPTRHIVRHGGTSRSASVLPVTSNLFSMLGRAPARGRSFEPADDGRSNAVLLSDRGWREVFEADPSVVGAAVLLDDRPFTIIGIDARAPLEFMPMPDMFVATDLGAGGIGDRTRRDFRVVGRLKPGVALPAAQADLQAVARQLAREHPDQAGRGAAIEGLRETYTGWNWRPLYFLLAAALFVLVLTCANVANLLLARALGRQREFAVRRALGGGRGALARQLLIEGMVVAVPGAALGLLLAGWAVAALPPWLPPEYLAREGAIGLDARAYLFALAVSAAATLAAGLAPLFITRSRDLNPLLGQGARSASGPPSQRRARNALVVMEVTIALVLLVGAGLFLNSFMQLRHVPLGFDPRDRLTMRVPVGGTRYADTRAIVDFSGRLVERARAVPGITRAAVATSVPLASGPLTRFVRGDRPRPAAGDESRAVIRAVSPGYFEALGITRLAGRDFSPQDADGAPRVAIVNENLAERIFPGENPVGRGLDIVYATAPWVGKGAVQIVGVVPNVKNVGLNEVAFNDIYVPFAQAPVPAMLLVARTDVPAATLTPALRAAVTALDPDIPLFGITTMDQRVAEALEADRFHLLLIGTFALLAIVLAGIGIYGVVAYTVEQRTREFGVRLALGARRSGIFALALAQCARLGAAGAAVGLGLSLALARLLGNALFLVPGQHNGLLYGVTLTDPATLASACTVLVTVVALAGLVPARRATRVDPAAALRCE